MALSKKDALDAAKAVLTEARAAELPRLERIHAALNPRVGPGCYQSTVQIPVDAPPLMRELARKSETNYLPLLVKTFAQVMKADGYYTDNDAGVDVNDPWVWWQRNRMDSRQTGLIRSALQYGAGYLTVLPGTYGRGLPGPSIMLFSPREMTALYQDPESDEWPMLAVSVDGGLVRLYDDEQVYTFGIETPSVYRFTDPTNSLPYSGGLLTYIDAKAHDLGVCPVIRARDRNLLAGEEQYGIVEPLMTINERIHELTFQMLVNDFFQAFKQRYILGWVPKDEQEKLKSGAARMWYFDDPGGVDGVTVGQLDGGDSSSVREDRAVAVRDFSAIGQIPAQSLGIDGISNISDATLAGLEAAKNREAGEITTSIGEALEQTLRLCAYIDGNQIAADDYNSEIRWRDFEARSYAQTVDGLVKLVQGLGLPAEIVLEDVPGMTEQKLARAKEAILEQRASSNVDLMLATTGAQPLP